MRQGGAGQGSPGTPAVWLWARPLTSLSCRFPPQLLLHWGLEGEAAGNTV